MMIERLLLVLANVLLMIVMMLVLLMMVIILIMIRNIGAAVSMSIIGGDHTLMSVAVLLT